MAIKKPNQIDTQVKDNNQRVSDEIKQRLDYQIKVEFDSSQIYRAMASWCEYKGYFNAAKFYNNHAEEELSHMKKVTKYAIDRNCLPLTPEIKKPDSNFVDLIDTIKNSYEHEKFISSTYEEFAQISVDNHDYTTFGFIQWFLKEQIEEESTFKNILDKIEMMKKEGIGMLEIENEISSGINVNCDNIG